MTRKSFIIGKSDPNSQPIDFDLTGTDLQGNPVGPFVFTCVAEMQGEYLNEVIVASEQSNALAVVQCTEFIRQCLISEEETEKFDEILHRKDLVIQSELIAAIFKWLVEEYSSRPTSAPSALPVGTEPISSLSMGADFGSVDPIQQASPSVNSSVPSMSS